MPGGPDYPLDESPRFTKAGLAAITTPEANNNLQGVIHTREGDIRTWVIAASAVAARRDLHLALAYLDVADRSSDARHTGLLARVGDLASTVETLLTSVQQQQDTLAQIVNHLGVIIPAWQTLTEVQKGDDMGLVRRSAADLGLTVDMNPLQLEPGFGHEEVVSIDPVPGTLVARGSTVRVRVNHQG